MLNKKYRHKLLFKYEQDLRRCELLNMNLTERASHLKTEIAETKELQQMVEKRIRTFCRLILSSVPGNGTENLNNSNVLEEINYTQNQFERMLVQNRITINDLLVRLSTKDAEIDGLKAQIMTTLINPRNNLNIEPIFTQKNDKELPSTQLSERTNKQILQSSVQPNIDFAPKKILDTPVSEPEQLPRRQPSQWRQEERVEGKSRIMIEDEPEILHSGVVKTNKTPIAHVVNLSTYTDKLDVHMWDILLAIGRDGKCESKEIEEFQQTTQKGKALFNSNISTLVKMGLLNKEKMSTGWRWAYIYTLSEMGERIFVERYKTKPVKNEKDILLTENTGIMHGYCVKDAATLLVKACGYNIVKTTRETTKTEIPGLGVYYPDIIAINDASNQPDYYEIERGTNSQEMFSLKCDKMRHVTQVLRFITPDLKSFNITEKMIIRYMLDNGSKLKGLKFEITTMSKLSEGKTEKTIIV